MPCYQDGTMVPSLINGENHLHLIDDITADYYLSCKPETNNGSYIDYHEKVITYWHTISDPAFSLDSVEAKRLRCPIIISDEQSVLNYADTNASKANITDINERLKGLKIAIIGIGGTGAFVLDHVSKTPVSEIHLFDDDEFNTHNAFRAPGAPDMQTLIDMPHKVDYLSNIYSKMHKHIIPHSTFVSNSDLNEIRDLNFVFICIDKGSIKKDIITFLNEKNTDIEKGEFIISVNVIEILLGQCYLKNKMTGNMSKTILINLLQNKKKNNSY